jgi:hypothetical protein
MKQTKTIPFDWEEYNSNRDKYKVVTRDGDEVTQLIKFKEISSYCPLVGVKNGFLYNWYDNGQFTSVEQSDWDLQLQCEEEVVESWINLFSTIGGGITTNGATFSSKEKADEVGKQWCNYIKSINLNDLV